jgi:hypothetical protein
VRLLVPTLDRPENLFPGAGAEPLDPANPAIEVSLDGGMCVPFKNSSAEVEEGSRPGAGLKLSRAWRMDCSGVMGSLLKRLELARAGFGRGLGDEIG